MTDSLQNITRGAYALAYQMLGERADALDVVQDAATKALTHSKVPAIESREYKSWFFHVVRNQALDLLRRQKRFIHEPFDESHGEPMTFDSPENNLESQQIKNHLDVALSKLTIAQKEIILLKDFHEFSYYEIAEILKIPVGSVMSRLHRARLSLRKFLITYQLKEVNSDDQM